MKLKDALSRAAGHVGRRDMVGVLGLGALTWGLWQESPTLAAVAGGLVLLYVGLFWGRS